MSSADPTDEGLAGRRVQAGLLHRPDRGRYLVWWQPAGAPRQWLAEFVTPVEALGALSEMTVAARRHQLATPAQVEAFLDALRSGAPAPDAPPSPPLDEGGEPGSIIQFDVPVPPAPRSRPRRFPPRSGE